jgi:uncharacterized protein involved in exopolysaccharide biosynthesis
LQAAVNEPEGTASKAPTGSAIMLAEANPTPSSPKGVMILGLAFLSALIAGIALALWLESRETDRQDLQASAGGISR